jgi:hypothetical protein
MNIGDKIRFLEPTRVEKGFVDCSTMLTVCQLDPLKAYWTTRVGKRVEVLVEGAFVLAE